MDAVGTYLTLGIGVWLLPVPAQITMLVPLVSLPSLALAGLCWVGALMNHDEGD